MTFFSENKEVDNQRFSQKNVLVTGSNGQLGYELKRYAERVRNNNLRFLFTNSSELDITNYEALEEYVADQKISYIINCAAYTAVDRAEDDVEKCYKVNRDGPLNLGKTAQKHSVRVIHISTDYVYDGKKNNPYNENDPTNPQSVYGKSKNEGEMALLENNPDTIIIRTSWLYSVHGNNFVKTMLKLGNERDTLNVVADQTGTPTNAADLAEAIISILRQSETDSFYPGIYLYSNEGTTTWYDFTLQIFKDAKITKCKVNPITTDQYPTRAKRPKFSVLDKNKIKKTFNLEIPLWEQSLKKCIDELIG